MIYGYERTELEKLEYALWMIQKSDPNREPNFAYAGRESLGITDARVISVSRDSDTLERSNFEVISEDLQSLAEEIGEPESVYIQRFGHWVVGWLDVLCVRMIEDPNLAILTVVGDRAIGWLDALRDYPVADESHYSELESEEFTDYLLDDLIPYEISEEIRERYSDDRILSALMILFQNSSNSEDLWYEIRELERAGESLDSALLDVLQREDHYLSMVDQERAGQIRLSDHPLWSPEHPYYD